MKQSFLQQLIKRKLRFCLSLLCGLMLLAQPGLGATVQAQGPQDASSGPTSQLELTLKQLGYKTERLAPGKSERFKIEVPENFQIAAEGNYLELVTRHFPELTRGSAALEVEVNGQLVATLPITGAGAAATTTRIDLPTGLLEGGNNDIKVTLAVENGDIPAQALRASIEADSSLSLTYRQFPYPADLSFYPFPFVGSKRQNVIEVPVTMVLPDAPTSADLSAAAMVAAGLGQKSGGDIALQAALAGSLSDELRAKSHLIIIGTLSDNALLQSLDLPDAVHDETLKAGQGLLSTQVSPWNDYRLVLAVTGMDNEGVTKASQALNRQAHFLGLQGPEAIITRLLPLPRPVTTSPERLTLADLGYQDQVVYGTDSQVYTFDFELPFGWWMTKSPFFNLRFAHTSVIDPLTSVLDVSLNGVPIDNTLLDDDNADKGKLKVSLPEHLLQAGRNRLAVRVEMHLPENGQRRRGQQDEQAWTVLSSQSELFLPYETRAISPDLRFFPYPFSQSSGLEQTLFVLPDEVYYSAAASLPRLNQLLQLVVALGSAAQTERLFPRVAYASEVDGDRLANNHLILLGRPTENGLLREINPNLPQPFVSGSDLLEPVIVDTIAFVPNPGRDAGLLETIISPWNENYNLLAITGTTDAGLSLAVRALLEETKDLTGNLAVIEEAFEPFSEAPGQIKTYAVNLQPITSARAISQGNGAIEITSIDAEEQPDARARTGLTPAGESDVVLLARRWWR